MHSSRKLTPCACAHPTKPILVKNPIAIALYVNALTLLPKACLEIWQGQLLPMQAITTSMLVFAGIAVAKRYPSI